jgi:cytochrome c6
MPKGKPVYQLAKKLLLTLFFTLIIINGLNQYPVLASELNSGEMIFDNTCAGCHANGGNIVKGWKNLKLKTLIKNQLDSPGAIADLVRHGKNNMSAYQDKLTPTEIEAVANYVWEQANHNWQKPKA